MTDGIEIRLRLWTRPAPAPLRFVIRHTSRSWFRLPRAERNRIRRGEEVRSVPRVYYRRTRAMRAMLAGRGID